MGAYDFGHFMDQATNGNGPGKPFWAVDFEDEDELLAWLKADMDSLKDQAKMRHLEQRKNLASYRGIRLNQLDTRNRDEQSADSQPGKRSSSSPRMIYNHMVDMVEQHVARLTKYRGAIAGKPASDDEEDRRNALISDKAIEAFWRKVNNGKGIDSLLAKHHRRKRILGDAYIGVFYDYSKGPYDPDYLAAVFAEAKVTGKDGKPLDPKKMRRGELISRLRKLGKMPRLKAVNPETGEQIDGEDGKPLYVDRPMRRGEIVYRLIFSWDMFLQRKDDDTQVEMGSFREWVNIDTLKAMHPKKAAKIVADPHGTMFDVDLLEDRPIGNMVEVFHTYHVTTENLDGGRYVKWCSGAILENRENRCRGWDYEARLPWVRTVDIDTPAVLNGDATVTHGRGPQAVYNNLVSLKIRNRFLYAYPKWFYPANSVNKDSLGANKSNMVSYKGAVPPALVQPRLEEGNDSAFMQESKVDLGQIMGTHGGSRGEPPKGVTAAVALIHLDEKEAERENPSIQAHTELLVELALLTLWQMAEHYDTDRLKDLLGKSNAYLLESFESTSFYDSNDLQVQNQTALPQQKSTRLQYLSEIQKAYPGAIPQDAAIDALGLAEVERIKNVVTVALKKADDENLAMMHGNEPDPPMEGEFHIAHYRAHRRQMNEPVFPRLPEASREIFKDHLRGTEYLMVEIGKKNPRYLVPIVAEFPDFPVFYRDETTDQADQLAVSQSVPTTQAPEAPEAAAPQEGQPIPPQDVAVPPGAGLQTPNVPGLPPGVEANSQGAAPV